jgi:hypothetical protein
VDFRTLVSSLFWRGRLANTAGRTYGGERNLYKALGYKRELEPSDYRSRYRRNAVANRVVKALPKATWRGGAELIEDEDPNSETPFEKSWFDLELRLKIWTVLQRADILAGIGRYAIILIGAPGDLDQPLVQCGADEIAFLTPFAEEDAPIQRFEIDIHNERYGQPVMYMVKRTNMASANSMNSSTLARQVHWTRVIHIADGLLDDNIYGEPRLESIWNLLDDLEKVSGGGAEAFWRRADGGTQWDLDPTLDLPDETDPDNPTADASPAALKQVKEDIEKIEHGLKKNIFTRGVKVNRMGSDVADFSNPVNSIISQISAGTGIPQRVLMGSEQGKLAAKMDRSNWDDRVQDRRDDFAGPMIVRPFVDRLIGLGALPPPKLEGGYDVRWSQLKILDDEQRSTIAGEWAKINQSAGSTVVTPDEIREHVLDLPPLSTVGDVPLNVPEPVAAAARKGVVTHKHVHKVADRFRSTSEKRRARFLQRRARQSQSTEAASSVGSEGRAGSLSRAERSGSLL